MKEVEHEQRDWIIVAIIILFGLLCVLVAGQWATRLAPTWTVTADMGSKLNPDSDYLTSRPDTLVEAVDPSILTEPVWINFYLTPNAIIPTKVRPADTSTPTSAPTLVPPTNTEVPTSTPTSTLVYIPPTRSATPIPGSTNTPAPRATSTPTGALTPTATYTSAPGSTNTPTPTLTPTNTSTPTSTPTDTPLPEADLAITNTDGVSAYDPNVASVRYRVVVSNTFGPSAVTGAKVTDTFSTNLSVAWTCTPSAGATCTASGMGNINDLVNLPVGGSVMYTVDAAIASYGASLVSSATVTPPTGIADKNTTNDKSDDTDEYAYQIGTDPDASVYNLMAGNYLTLNFNITVNGANGSNWDLVYYELPMGSGILLDMVVVEIGDGTNWYPIFNWGDAGAVADTNTNMNYNILTLKVPDPQEHDQREIADTDLYPSASGLRTGIAINLDGVVPPKTYSYIRFYAPTSAEGDVDGKMEIDAIQKLIP